MVDAWPVQDGLLFGCEFVGPSAVARLWSEVFARRSGRAPGSVFVEHGAPLRLALPRQGAVGGSLGEEEDIAGAHGGLDDQFPVLCERADLGRGRLAGFVAAGDHGKAAVSGVAVGQLPSHGDASAVDFAVLLMIPSGGAKRLARAVQVVPFGALGGADEQGAVVEAKARAAEFVEAGDDGGMGPAGGERIRGRGAANRACR